MKKGYCKSSITALPKVLCIKAKNNRPCYEACCALRKKRLKKIKRTLNFVYTLVFYPISMVIMENNIDITQHFPTLLQTLVGLHVSHEHTLT